jgi:hypothetical protein
MYTDREVFAKMLFDDEKIEQIEYNIYMKWFNEFIRDFPNILHNNTHFAMQLLSFKIPMNAGYQAIAFNADSQNFSQYVEISDTHFILNNLKLVVYDTRGNILINQYNWNFTLGFET